MLATTVRGLFQALSLDLHRTCEVTSSIILHLHTSWITLYHDSLQTLILRCCASTEMMNTKEIWKSAIYPWKQLCDGKKGKRRKGRRRVCSLRPKGTGSSPLYTAKRTLHTWTREIMCAFRALQTPSSFLLFVNFPGWQYRVYAWILRKDFNRCVAP